MPEPAPDFESALQLLESRPFDKFLHRYCLSLLLRCGARDLPNRARQMQASAAGLKVLLEAASQLPELRQHIAHRQEGQTPASETHSEFPDRLPKNLLEKFHANIHLHTPIELSESELEIITARAHIGNMSCKLKARFAAQAGNKAPAPAQDVKSLYEYANQALAKLGIVSSSELRHEASLSPVALLREWHLDCGVAGGANRHSLKGVATAYGRGLSLGQAKISCIMEIVERASAFARIQGAPLQANGWVLPKASRRSLAGAGTPYILPATAFAFGEDEPIFWREGSDCLGRLVCVPAQAVYLFLNLDEPAICEPVDSTGLGAGQTPEQAQLAALTEVLERHAHATTPFLPGQCFRPASRDPHLQGLLDDYRWRGIHVQLQDITTELGLPAYRCFVKGIDGSISQATGANLSGKKAALAALTETPWPYSWATGRPSPSARAPLDQPVRFLEDLPDYSLGNDKANLKLLESALMDCGLNPVYIDLTRPDISLPVFRCLLPGLETDTEFETNTGAVFAGRLAAFFGLGAGQAR